MYMYLTHRLLITLTFGMYTFIDYAIRCHLDLQRGVQVTYSSQDYHHKKNWCESIKLNLTLSRLYRPYLIGSLFHSKTISFIVFKLIASSLQRKSKYKLISKPLSLIIFLIINTIQLGLSPWKQLKTTQIDACCAFLCYIKICQDHKA